MSRQFWNTVREALQVRKIKGSLTVPAASYSTFRQHGCIEYSVSDANDNKYVSTLLSTTAFSIEMMVKPLSSITTKQVLLIYGDTTPQVEISMLDNVLSVRVWKGGVPTTVSATGYFTTYDWNGIAVTYDNVTIRLFVNGVLVASGALAGAVDAFSVFAHVGQSAPTTEQFIGRIAELRVWNVTRSIDQILGFYNKPRNIGMDDVTGLIAYFKLNGVSVDGTGREQNQVDTTKVLSASQSKLTTEDSPPLIFGASFSAADIDVVLTNPLSFRFPVARPDGCTGELVIRWLDDDGEVQRRKFWTLDGVDIHPDPAIYLGERVAASFTLEWWNVDGAETLEVPDDIILRISQTTNPTASNDDTAVEASTITADTTIGEPYPLTYPLTFNTIQTYV